MAGNVSGSPLFAGRYKFQTVGNDWDTGRSGFTYLVFDVQKERLGVIKRAEITSIRSVEGLKNEVAALLDLKDANDQHVPEVYETGEAEHGSKNYFYIVIEYIEGIRVEKNVNALAAVERAEILTQFFSLLAKAHRMGIVNGDVDLKHLFWRRDKKQLIVIDWGNARLNIDPRKKEEFAYDLARSAEIIRSLVTLPGQRPATGSFVLPNDSGIVPGLRPIPPQFRNLCKWAPRVPSAGAEAPYTSQELFEVSRKWQKTVRNIEYPKRANWGLGLLSAFLLLAALAFLGLSPASPLYPVLHPATPTPTPSVLGTASSTLQPSVTNTSIVISTKTPATPTIATTILTTVAPVSPTASASSTPIPSTSPQALAYNPVLVSNTTNLPQNECWATDTQLTLNKQEGFSRRSDGNWRFAIDQGRTPMDYLRIDFGSCLENPGQVNGIAVNVWISRLELQRKSLDLPDTIEDGRQFGIFYENSTGTRREYTLWVDQNKALHLRVREGEQILSDNEVLVVNSNILKVDPKYLRRYASFPIQILLEINNQGVDILHLREGPLQAAVPVESLDPAGMRTADQTKTLGDVKKLGIVGYGGDTQTLIWPLVFFGE